jgi:hypothetical protein
MIITSVHLKWYPHVIDMYMIMSCGEVCVLSLPRCETYVALLCRTWCCHGINECASILAWEPSEAHSLMRGQGHVWQRNVTWAWRFRTVCRNSHHKWSWQIIIRNGHYKWSLNMVITNGHFTRSLTTHTSLRTQMHVDCLGMPCLYTRNTKYGRVTEKETALQVPFFPLRRACIVMAYNIYWLLHVRPKKVCSKNARPASSSSK